VLFSANQCRQFRKTRPVQYKNMQNHFTASVLSDARKFILYDRSRHPLRKSGPHCQQVWATDILELIE